MRLPVKNTVAVCVLVLMIVGLSVFILSSAKVLLNAVTQSLWHILGL